MSFVYKSCSLLWHETAEMIYVWFPDETWLHGNVAVNVQYIGVMLPSWMNEIPFAWNIMRVCVRVASGNLWKWKPGLSFKLRTIMNSVIYISRLIFALDNCWREQLNYLLCINMIVMIFFFFYSLNSVMYCFKWTRQIKLLCYFIIWHQSGSFYH